MSTLLAPVLLAATGIMTVLDNLLAIALSTLVYIQCGDHSYTISLRFDHYRNQNSRKYIFEST